MSLLGQLAAHLNSNRTIQLALGALQLEKQLGQGANAIVWSGTLSGESVAVKFLCSDDRGKIARFKNEYFRVVTRGSLSGIVRMFQFELIHLANGDEYPLIIMERCKSALSSIPDELVGQEEILFRQLLNAAESLHRNAIYHRDIKPQNIFRRNDGQFVLGDLGIAYFDDRLHAGVEPKTEKGERLGNYKFSAPEQEQGICSAVSDLFAIGQVMMWLINGRTLNGSMPLIPPERRKELAHLEAALRSILQAEPSARTQSVLDVLAILDGSIRRKKQEDAEERILDAVDKFGDVLLENSPGKTGVTNLNATETDELLEGLSKIAGDIDLVWVDSTDSSLEISRMEKLLPKVWLIDSVEFSIGTAWIYRHYSDDDRGFIVLHLLAQQPLGNFARQGDAWEEVGIFGSNVVSRAEYDDDCAKIGGKTVRFDGRCQLRCRFLQDTWVILSTKWSQVYLHTSRAFRRGLFAKIKAANSLDLAYIEREIFDYERHKVISLHN